jgi:hypothetical protein
MNKPLSLEFYGVAQKNKGRMHTECKECKLKYMKKWQANRKAEQEIDKKRDKYMYTIKEYTEEEKQQRMKEAYAYMHYQAFGKPIPGWKLKELEGIEE